MKNKSVRFIASALIIAGLGLGAQPAFAGEVDAEVQSGPLTAEVTPITFAPFAVDFYNQGQSTLATVNVSDLTGTGDGWIVSMEAADFDGPEGPGSLGAENLIYAASSPVVWEDGQPIDADHGPYVSQAPTGALNQPRVVMQADPGYGMGAYSETLSVYMVLPGGSLAGAYSTVLTVSVIATPPPVEG